MILTLRAGIVLLLLLCFHPCMANPPRFEADTRQVPELQPWGKVAEALCEVWYPKIVGILKSNDRERPLPPVVPIIFEKDMDGVAYVAEDKMHIAAKWVTSHPGDFGMVIHELTHLVQRYPENKAGDAGWLVEGIADYVRGYHFEPNVTNPRINFKTAKYTDAYKTTAAFLRWTEKRYTPDLVARFQTELRAGKYRDYLFVKYTGKDVDTLWKEFAASGAEPASGAEVKKVSVRP